MNGIKQRGKAVGITSFPRIHITLIGMNQDGYRINGSIGFSISAPKIDVYFEESKTIEIINQRGIKFTEHEKTRLKNVLTESINKFGFKKRIKYTICSDVMPHYGLGSNTAIYMSCIEALFIINEFEYGQNDIVKASKRGGTSGVGINTYFDGGFIFDIGIKNNKKSQFIPSSVADRNGETPLVIHKCKLPDWRIGICIPTFIKNKSEQEEVDFFKKHCPIDKNSIEPILYEAVYGITSSVIEKDYENFCKSVNTIQITRWKYLEREQYGDKLIELEQRIKAWGADCVGMSSLGPILFFAGINIDKIIKSISNNISETACFDVSLNNQGRIINYD